MTMIDDRIIEETDDFIAFDVNTDHGKRSPGSEKIQRKRKHYEVH